MVNKNFILGLDLGQANDFTALGVIEVQPDRVYHIRRLERVRGVAYPDVAEKVHKIMKALGGGALVVDQTGVGAPVVDLLKKAGLNPVAVSIHGGDSVTHEGRNWRVPKRNLVAVLQVLLQTSRLKVSSGLKLGPDLQKEMLNFKVKIDPVTAHDSYSAWRENDHDDMVLATALACWWAESRPKPQPPLVLPMPTKEQMITPRHRIGGYDGQPRVPKFF